MITALMGGSSPDLGSMLNIKCAVCIEQVGPDARQATTLAAGSLVCDDHAAAVIGQAERDSDNLATVREALELMEARTLEHLPTRPESDAMVRAELERQGVYATATATPRHATPCPVAQCEATHDSDTGHATGAGQ